MIPSPRYEVQCTMGTFASDCSPTQPSRHRRTRPTRPYTADTRRSTHAALLNIFLVPLHGLLGASAAVLTLQSGHIALTSSQGSRHPEWKSWPQGSTLIWSSGFSLGAAKHQSIATRGNLEYTARKIYGHKSRTRPTTPGSFAGRYTRHEEEQYKKGSKTQRLT